MIFQKKNALIVQKEQTVWAPPLQVQTNLWGDVDYLPVTRREQKEWQRCKQYEFTSTYNHRFGNYLNKNHLPPNVQVEGVEEFPCVQPFTIDLPKDIVGIDEKIPSNREYIGVHGFCYDSVLNQKWNNWSRTIMKASKFYCAIAPQFSVLMDGYRCDAVEAIRKNRVATLSLQLHGVPTLQSVSLTSARFFDIAYDGLAPNCPVALENMCTLRNPQLQSLFRIGVEKLIERKSPTILVVVGNILTFDPGIPVVYYKSRIQKLRNHEYNK